MSGEVKVAADEDSELIGYLLGGQAPGPDLERLEERLFIDDRLFDRLLWLEDALIDAHICGNLGAPERRHFESFFLASPRRLRKWEARRDTAALRGARRPGTRRVRTGWWRPPVPPARAAWAVACVFLAAFLGLEGLSLERANKAVLDLRERLAAIELRAGSTPAAVFVLAPGRLRSAGTSALVLTGAEGATLRLVLPEDAAGSTFYEAALSAADGEVLWKQARLSRSAGNYLLVQLPASVLTPDDYALYLWEVAGDGRRRALPSYSFRVPKGA
jgi:hypothetical protein